MKSLRFLWEKWKVIGQVIGDVLARIILSIFYITFFMPFALGLRLIGNPLRIKSNGNNRFWVERRTPDPSLESAKRQF